MTLFTAKEPDKVALTYQTTSLAVSTACLEAFSIRVPTAAWEDFFVPPG
jgi:hypothetical protein